MPWFGGGTAETDAFFVRRRRRSRISPAARPCRLPGIGCVHNAIHAFEGLFLWIALWDAHDLDKAIGLCQFAATPRLRRDLFLSWPRGRLGLDSGRGGPGRSPRRPRAVGRAGPGVVRRTGARHGGELARRSAPGTNVRRPLPAGQQSSPVPDGTARTGSPPEAALAQPRSRVMSSARPTCPSPTLTRRLGRRPRIRATAAASARNAGEYAADLVEDRLDRSKPVENLDADARAAVAGQMNDPGYPITAIDGGQPQSSARSNSLMDSPSRWARTASVRRVAVPRPRPAAGASAGGAVPGRFLSGDRRGPDHRPGLPARAEAP